MAAAPTHLTCPRCAYDVSGPIPTWRDACPLDGQCPECGLAFRWVDIFRPEHLFPAWSFEHATRRRCRALVRTLTKSLRPRRMWAEIPLAAPLRLFRLALLAALVLLSTHAAIGGIASAAAAPYMRRSGFIGGAWSWYFDWNALWRRLAWPYGGGSLPDYLPLPIGPIGFVALLWGALIPAPYLVLVQTMARARCRRVHLLRGWLYFLPSLCVVALADALFMYAQTQVRGTLAVLVWNTRVWIALALFLLAAWWYAHWWRCFTRSYLRLEQDRLVLALMLVIAFLASLAVCTALSQDLLDLGGAALNALFDSSPKRRGHP